MKQLKKHLRRSVTSFRSVDIASADMMLNFVIEFVIHQQVVKLLAYISDKDLFAEFYRYMASLLHCEPLCNNIFRIKSF